MRTLIVSDLHIGSPFFLYKEFAKFLDQIPDNVVLVLNGDTIDDPKQKLNREHQYVLDRIVELSERLSVVWIYGNHDEGFVLAKLGKIEFKTTHEIENRLAVFHGHDFDNVMPYHSWFIRGFKLLHNLRIKVGARPIHVAHYAKNWSTLYKYLRKNVLMNAIEYCREHGFDAVTCGHVHYPEDVYVDGIRYLNTGSWTEDKTFYIAVDEDEITLVENDSRKAVFA